MKKLQFAYWHVYLPSPPLPAPFFKEALKSRCFLSKLPVVVGLAYIVISEKWMEHSLRTTNDVTPGNDERANDVMKTDHAEGNHRFVSKFAVFYNISRATLAGWLSDYFWQKLAEFKTKKIASIS